ncbi:UNVERIFIED_CONTAM: hypothetical protein RMT77_012639 [Armadillidium vulgare]|nr:Gastrula zinc finger protein XlCGF8.2DB [Armadillidium vulgare]
MEDASYVIYEECTSNSALGNEIFKTTPASSTFQIPSSLVVPSISIPLSQENQSTIFKQSIPVTQVIKEDISLLSHPDINETSKSPNTCHYNVLPSGILHSSVLTLHDDIFKEDGTSKLDDSSESLVDGSSYEAVDTGTGLKLLLTPIQYSSLLRPNSNEKYFNYNSSNILTFGENCSNENFGDLSCKTEHCSDDITSSSSSLSSAPNSAILDPPKGKKNLSKSHVVLKLVEDDPSLSMIEIISSNANNSQVNGIVEKNSNGSQIQFKEEIPGIIKILPSDVKTIQQVPDFIDNIGNVSLFYSCSKCSKIIPYESFHEHKLKDCIQKNKKNVQFDKENVDSGSLTKSSSDNIKSNLTETKSALSWFCLICSQEFLSSVDLKYHYTTHNVEELSSALLKYSYQNNRMVKPGNTDQVVKSGIKIQLDQYSDVQNKKLTLYSDNSNKENNLNSDLSVVCDSTNNNSDDSFIISQSKNLLDIDLNTPNKDINSDLKSNFLIKSRKKINKTGLKSRDPHTCPVCKKVLSSRGNLAKHLIQHQEIKPWVCKECGIGFNSKRNHDLHYLQRHTTLRPNVCSICGKGFSNKRTLLEHTVFHKKEREFKCELCGKLFRTKKCVNRHMLRHETNKKFSCGQCFKAFRVKIDLLAHIKLVHNAERKKKMKTCNLTTEAVNNNNNSLNIHLENCSDAVLPSQMNLTKNKVQKFYAPVHTHHQLQIISNEEQGTKLTECPDLLNLNPTLPVVNNDFQPLTVPETRDPILVNADDVNTHTIIPAESEESVLPTSLSFPLHHSKEAILKENTISENTFVMIGLTHLSEANKSTWDVSQDLKPIPVYQDSNSEEDTSHQPIPVSDISFLSLENISSIEEFDNGLYKYSI